MDQTNQLRPTEEAFRPVSHPNCVPCLKCGNTTVLRIIKSGANGVACSVCQTVYDRTQMAEMEARPKDFSK